MALPNLAFCCGASIHPVPEPSRADWQSVSGGQLGGSGPVTQDMKIWKLFAMFAIACVSLKLVKGDIVFFGIIN